MSNNLEKKMMGNNLIEKNYRLTMGSAIDYGSASKIDTSKEIDNRVIFGTTEIERRGRI